MFAQLFAESGLSLDRLKAFVEVGAAGSIVKAADADPVRQSQYSRQIKELEDFFRTRLIERQGKGTRLTSNGKELARISRFFMLGLSNFQRGCLAEEQTFHIGASATFTRQFLMPVVTRFRSQKCSARFASEVVNDDEIERRLHDLTLDFGIVGNATLSRPLKTAALGEWRLELWMPTAMRLTKARAAQAFKERRLPLSLAAKELAGLGVFAPPGYPAHLACDSFVDSRVAMESEQVAALLPHFLAPARDSKSFIQVLELDARLFHFHLAWNPRLLRLNPHATHMRDSLAASLTSRIRK